MGWGANRPLQSEALLELHPRSLAEPKRKPQPAGRPAWCEIRSFQILLQILLPGVCFSHLCLTYLTCWRLISLLPARVPPTPPSFCIQGPLHLHSWSHDSLSLPVQVLQREKATRDPSSPEVSASTWSLCGSSHDIRTQHWWLETPPSQPEHTRSAAHHSSSMTCLSSWCCFKVLSHQCPLLTYSNSISHGISSKMIPT